MIRKFTAKASLSGLQCRPSPFLPSGSMLECVISTTPAGGAYQNTVALLKVCWGHDSYFELRMGWDK